MNGFEYSLPRMREDMKKIVSLSKVRVRVRVRVRGEGEGEG